MPGNLSTPKDMPLSCILDDNEHEGLTGNGIGDILPFMERSPDIPDRAKKRSLPCIREETLIIAECII